MNDRELLEMAAKAAGYDIVQYSRYSGLQIAQIEIGWWNPIKDDGDALRLAVALGMEVYIDDHPDGCDCVEAESHTHKSGRFLLSLSAGNDKYAAVRKTIVMVAAEIGKSM